MIAGISCSVYFLLVFSSLKCYESVLLGLGFIEEAQKNGALLSLIAVRVTAKLGSEFFSVLPYSAGRRRRVNAVRRQQGSPGGEQVDGNLIGS